MFYFTFVGLGWFNCGVWGVNITVVFDFRIIGLFFGFCIAFFMICVYFLIAFLYLFDLIDYDYCLCIIVWVLCDWFLGFALDGLV